MKVVHVGDLHLGQVLYQYYERGDEHAWVLGQLTELCRRERPDALVVCGDVFDIQQPSARVWKVFNDYFVSLRQAVPEMAIVIIAGNHDSPARLQSSASIWEAIGVRVIGTPPPSSAALREEGWEERFVVSLPTGYIVGVPFLGSGRTDGIADLLRYVDERNEGGLPVVLCAHMAVGGSDFTGHDMDIGTLRTIYLEEIGSGYDYLALGHIHRPQTIGHPEDLMIEDVTYPAPVARYSGSTLHVSTDEAYPHTFSIVEISGHGGEVRIRQERINQLRHFHIVPSSGEGAADGDEALKALEEFVAGGGEGYFRFRVNASAWLPSDFNQRVYAAIEPHGDRLRYNPRIIWVGKESATSPEALSDDSTSTSLDIVEIQEMTDPLTFIERTIDRYEGLDLNEVREAFREIEAEIRSLKE